MSLETHRGLARHDEVFEPSKLTRQDSKSNVAYMLENARAFATRVRVRGLRGCTGIYCTASVTLTGRRPNFTNLRTQVVKLESTGCMTILFGGKPTEAELFSISLAVTSAKSINGNSYFFGHNRSFFCPKVQ